MVAQTRKLLNDYPAARWAALILIALMMFFAYMFVDVLSPLQSLIGSQRGWDGGAFGTYASSEYILNVLGFLILAGIILDKMGVRFTGTLSASLMVIGAAVKFIAVSEWFQGTALCGWLGSWWTALPGSAKLACLGFMIFGCGCEMAGTTVSKAIAKWFKGKEMALAMGLEMAIARLGVTAVMWLSPMIADKFGNADGIIDAGDTVVPAILVCGCLLCIGLMNFLIFSVMDTRLDKQLIQAGLATDEKSPEDEFHISDLGAIFRSKMFWLVALLCVLYYSAIFPFQRYAPNMLEVTLDIDAAEASRIFSFFPFRAMVLTPVLGIFLDHKGKGASMLMAGAATMIVCHLCFAFVLPAFPKQWFAVLLVVVLGVSFSLVPAALWPSVPKIIDEKILGSAYCLIFWVQNIGLCLVPSIIGHLRESTGGYVIPMVVFSCFGVLAFIFSIYLKAEDKKKGYGLELPNIQK